MDINIHVIIHIIDQLPRSRHDVGEKYILKLMICKIYKRNREVNSLVNVKVSILVQINFYKAIWMKIWIEQHFLVRNAEKEKNWCFKIVERSRQTLDDGSRQRYIGPRGETALCPSSCLALAKIRVSGLIHYYVYDVFSFVALNWQFFHFS